MENQLSKLFSAFGYGGGGRLNLKSNVFGPTGSRYSMIGGTGSGKYGSDSTSNRNSPTVGNSVTNNNLSSYYSKMSEIKSYYLTDISEMIVSLFRDYIINFMNKNGDIITIKNQDGEVDKNKTERINDILTSDLKLPDVIKQHLPEIIYYGSYHFMISQYKDETGHTRLKRKDFLDPVVIVSKTKNHDEITYIARGKDDNIYEVPMIECIKLGSDDLRLVNDMQEDKYSVYKSEKSNKQESNRDKVTADEFYSVSKPLYYSITHKVKEYLLKDTIISLLSIKDLVQPLVMSLHFDKGTSIETANELTKKVENMVNKYTDLSAILTSQFGITDLLDSLLNNIRVIPDFNSSMSNMGTIDLNKITQKIQEIRMELDNCRENVLSTMGIPLDLFSGRVTKWEALKTSERLNSRINSFINTIKSSVINAARVVNRNLYNNEDIDPDSIEVHMFSKTTVEYNNQINNAEAISSIAQQIATVLEISLRTLEMSGPLFDQKGYLEYVNTLLKGIDPEIEKFMSSDQIESYLQFLQQKQMEDSPEE